MKNLHFQKIILLLILFSISSSLFAQQTIWKHSRGSFRQENGNNWVEFGESRRGNSFIKTAKSNYDQTILYDRSRDCYVWLAKSECFVAFNGGNYTKLYDGGWSTNSGFDDEMGIQAKTTIVVTPAKTKEEIDADLLENRKKQLEIERLEREKKEFEEAKKLKQQEEENERQRIAEAERQKKAAEEKQKIADDIKRIKDEDKAVGGANTRLKNGLIGGNFEMVKKAIAEKADANTIYENGENTLFFALKYAKILDFLIEKGADVNQKRDKDGATPLHLVENLDAAKSIANYSRDINALDNNNLTPLESAIQKNKIDIAMHLIDKGADVNVKNGNPLRLAIQNEKTDLITYLIKKGVNINENNGEPLRLAIEKNKSDLAIYFIEKVISIDVNIGNPLSHAIQLKKSNIAILLIDKGADVNESNGTPLALACGMDYVPIQMEIAKKLLSKGADPNQCPNRLDYPLHLSAKNDNYELASMLLEKGANIDLKDGEGKKAKSYAKDKELKKLLKD